MAYIIPTKKYKKIFGKKNVKKIFALFEELTGVDWTNREYTDFLKNKNIIYPATGEHDDTEGISAEQMKIIFDKFEGNLKIIEKWFKKIQLDDLNYFEDDFFSWKKAMNEIYLPKLEEKDFIDNFAIDSFKNELPKEYKYDRKIYIHLLYGKLKISDVITVTNIKFYEKGKTLFLKDLKIKDYLEDQKNEKEIKEKIKEIEEIIKDKSSDLLKSRLIEALKNIKDLEPQNKEQKKQILEELNQILLKAKKRKEDLILQEFNEKLNSSSEEITFLLSN